MVQALLSLAALDNTATNPRSCLREGRIKKSEENVFINPFSEDLDKGKFFNIASRRPLVSEVTEELLSVEIRGHEMFQCFDKRMSTNEEDQEVAFFDPIKRAPWKGFVSVEKKQK